MSPAAWHALLAPLPAEVRPRRSPVASPELVASGAAAAIAGWEALLVELTAAAAGLRMIQVVVDGEGRLLSASDHVLFRSADSEPALIRQESIGGRFESDGGFHGTHWEVEGPEPADEEEPRWTMTPRPPSDAEIALLRELVAEVIRRAPPAAAPPP